MNGPAYTPTEAVNIVARRHAQLVQRGADHKSALRLVVDQYGLRPEAALWAVSTAQSGHRADVPAGGRQPEDARQAREAGEATALTPTRWTPARRGAPAGEAS